MFSSVLIANRGTVACRIAQTLRRLGVRVVAIYSDADRDSAHVRAADSAVRIGPAPARDSYLRADAIVEAALAAGAEAVHPGYGFLAENAEFAERCEAAGLVFIGPTPDQIRAFGLKHAARALADAAQMPVLPGSDLLADGEAALAAAREVGFPLMLKSTAGGGGIGMERCDDEAALTAAWQRVTRLAAASFGDGGLYVERYVPRARHVEVQVFGDGGGRVLTLGDRDCTVQRRRQKVIEEAPAPGLSQMLRDRMGASAVNLAARIAYRSAGTVEYIHDPDRDTFYFLEVNTRLQVEHAVTEAVTGVDLVEWMVRGAAGDFSFMDEAQPRAAGHAIEARLYAEDPARDFQPCAGLLTAAGFPDDVRVDTWVAAGTEVTAHYDPMLATMVVQADDRAQAIAGLRSALARTELGGIETNREYLRAVLASDDFHALTHHTGWLDGFVFQPETIEVLHPGTQSTLQDLPGRIGYWPVGVPPSGPMDDLAHRLANRAVGNDARAVALEMTHDGATLRFNRGCTIALAGAPMDATLDGAAVDWWVPVEVSPGAELRVGSLSGRGHRAYLAVRGGFDVPAYLGSRSTFTLGRFGGHAGRALVAGDVLRIATEVAAEPAAIADAERPRYSDQWELAVTAGPHGAPEFFTAGDIDMVLTTHWEVHYNSSRTGVRLVGPRPRWARPDGGEAGLHPSNIHDNAYAVGTLDFTGDLPILLGPDGPSLGGFVCPFTVTSDERWKLGQLAAGDRVRFRPVSAVEPVLGTRPAAERRPQVCYRQAGDRYVLIEYGPQVLDLNLRFRVHALMQRLEAEAHPGILELTPGIRSLQVHHDPRRLSQRDLVTLLEEIEPTLPAVEDMRVPSRLVHLPLSWDDPSTRLAIERYTAAVRPDAPWCPSNIEFIRRINGLDDIEQVREIVFAASYLVLGLGDVYLGAPVATPIDPRHRLVTTKYNPARTWTPENAVGIGGAYLCVYGMEGPGGYQFVGRTVQMWNRFRVTRDFEPGQPWLLRHFDRLRFYPVEAAELEELRADFLAGRFALEIEDGELDLAAYNRFLNDHADSIAAFKHTQQAAFDAERARWQAAGLEFTAEDPRAAGPDAEADERPADCVAVAAPMTGCVWKLDVEAGERVEPGTVVMVLEAMKTEIPVLAGATGEVVAILCAPGATVVAGQAVAYLRPIA